MARYRRRDQIEVRVADDLEGPDGGRYSVDLIAKRATGVDGFKCTLSFIAEEDGPNAFVELEPASGRQEARDRGEQLAEDPERLRALLREELAGG
ncbi:MAG: hypothetical protein ABEJ46_03590 [Gemmatimonadota bacterium]